MEVPPIEDNDHHHAAAAAAPGEPAQDVAQNQPQDDEQNDDDDDDRRREEHQGEAEEEDDEDFEQQLPLNIQEMQQAGWNEPEMIEHFEFSSQCRRMMADDPEMTMYDASRSLDDESAVRVARTLIGNSFVTAMTVTLSPQLTRRGARALAGAIMGSNVQLLSIHGDVLSLDASHAYVHPLQTVVDHAIFSCSMDDHQASRLGKCLVGNTILHTLVLHVKDHHLSRWGANCLSRGMAQSRIQHFELVGPQGEAASEPAIAAMKKLYVEGIQNCSSLQELTVSQNVGDVSALSTILPTLRKFILEDVTLTASELEILSRGFTQAPKLQSISFLQCHLGDEHMHILSPSLGRHPGIKKLELTGNVFGDAGVASWVEHWSAPHSNLRQWNLSHNPNMGPRGAQAVVRAVCHHSQLRRLNLESNKGIGYDGLDLIGQELAGKKLMELNVTEVAEWTEYDNVTSDEAKKQESKRAAAGRSLLEGMRGNVFLHVLHMDGMNLIPAVEQELQVYVQANRMRRGLLLKQDKLPPTIWCHFLARQGVNSSLLFLFLRELDVWMHRHGDILSAKRKRGLDGNTEAEPKRHRVDESA